MSVVSRPNRRRVTTCGDTSTHSTRPHRASCSPPDGRLEQMIPGTLPCSTLAQNLERALAQGLDLILRAERLGGGPQQRANALGVGVEHLLHGVPADAHGVVDHDPARLDDTQPPARRPGELGQVRERVLPRDRAVAPGHRPRQDGVAPAVVEPGEHAQEVDGGGGDAQAGLGRLEGDVETHLDRGLARHVDHRMVGRRVGGHDDAPRDIERVEDELGGSAVVESVGGQGGAARPGQEAARHATRGDGGLRRATLAGVRHGSPLSDCGSGASNRGKVSLASIRRRGETAHRTLARNRCAAGAEPLRSAHRWTDRSGVVGSSSPHHRLAT